MGMFSQGQNKVTNNYSTTNKTVVNRNNPTNQNYTGSSSQGTNMGQYGGFAAMRSETPGQYQSSPPNGMQYYRSETPGQYQTNPPNGMVYSRSNPPSPWDMYSQSSPSQQYTTPTYSQAPAGSPQYTQTTYSQSSGGSQYPQNYDSANSIRQLSSALNPGKGQTQEGQTGPNSWERITQNPNGTYNQTVASSRAGLSGNQGTGTGPLYAGRVQIDPVTKRVLPPKVWV